MTTATDNALLSQFWIVKSHFERVTTAARAIRIPSGDLEYEIDRMQNAMDSLQRRIKDSM